MVKEFDEYSRAQTWDIEYLIERFKVPDPIKVGGQDLVKCYQYFFQKRITNKNTRGTYRNSIGKFYDWWESHGLSNAADDALVLKFIHSLGGSLATKRLTLTAIRKLYDWFAMHGLANDNPAINIKHKWGGEFELLPRLQPVHIEPLLAVTDKTNLVEKRDVAILSVIAYTFASTNSIVNMTVGDFDFTHLIFREKTGRFSLPAHDIVQKNLKEYIRSAGIGDELSGPLFRNSDRSRAKNRLLPEPLTRTSMLKMVKRRLEELKVILPDRVAIQSLRGVGVKDVEA